MNNTYRLKVGGKETIVNSYNLQSAIEKEGYKILSMEHECYRKPNGKYFIRCVDNITIRAEWVEKVNRLKQN